MHPNIILPRQATAQELYILDVVSKEVAHLDKVYHIYPSMKINRRFTNLMGRAWTEGVKAPLIEISSHPTEKDYAQIVDTSRHEYAHLLAHPRGGKNHDAIWKAAAVECGANPKRCYSIPAMSNEFRASTARQRRPKAVRQCPGCGMTSRKAHRNLELWLCSECRIPMSQWAIIKVV